jgi:DNA repair exonuclease SbcCD nuclease subunit
VQPSSNGHRGDVIIAHTSDLHIGGRSHIDGHLTTLHAVVDAARDARAHALVLAGDIFDSHRVPDSVIAEAAAALAAAPLEVVILPGNHDPAVPDAVYRRGIAEPANVHVLGVSAPDAVFFDELDLEVSGVAHMTYADMPPADLARRRSRRWHVVVAHAHWVRGPHDTHRAWLIHDDDLAAIDADYIALGHWDLPQPAGDGRVPAHYSGSPELARTINIVRLSDAGVDVRRHPLALN